MHTKRQLIKSPLVRLYDDDDYDKFYYYCDCRVKALFCYILALALPLVLCTYKEMTCIIIACSFRTSNQHNQMCSPLINCRRPDTDTDDSEEILSLHSQPIQVLLRLHCVCVVQAGSNGKYVAQFRRAI